MSAVRATNSVSREPSPLAGDVSAMQDVLYDILATGLDLEQSEVPSAEIERFLHEHARATKSAAEFHAFFAKHGLSVRTLARGPAPALSLPPLERAEDAAAKVLPFASEVRPAEAIEPDTSARRFPEAAPIEFEPGPRANRLRMAAFAAAAAIALGALGAGAYYAHTTIHELKAELSRVTRSGLENQQAIDALRSNASSLQTSVAATSAIVQRVDEKSDLLLQTLREKELEAARRHRY